MARTISQFQPLQSASLEECEEHYRRIHTPYARRMLRAKPHVLSYHTARAVSRRDLRGTWQGRPTAFRYIFLQFEPGRSLEFTDAERAAVNEDHRFFLRELRGFAVATDHVVDRLSGQLALASYIFEVDRSADEDPAASAGRLRSLGEGLASLEGEAFGLRRLSLSTVTDEFRAEPIDEPGQRPTRDRLDRTDRAGFVELHFDQAEWAEEWFSDHRVRVLLDAFAPDTLTGHRIEIECGLDRTSPHESVGQSEPGGN